MSTRNIIQALQSAAGAAAGGAGLDVDEVFSTHLYDGTGSAQTITNNVDLTEGGLVWLKHRSSSSFSAADHWLIDTERGGTKYLNSNDAGAEAGNQNYISAFNSNGFTLGTSDAEINFGSGNSKYTSWTFRKAPNFFDVVTYSGNGQSTRTLSHNIGGNVGMVLIKGLNETEDWQVYHRSVSTGKILRLNNSGAEGNLANGVDHVSGSTITLSTAGNPSYSANDSGVNYVAYIFAHNNSDGGFGPDSDQDIIKCGSYTGAGSGSSTTVNLGFEPQFVLLKNSSSSSAWSIVDSMRGLVTGGNDQTLEANATGAEYAADLIDLTSTGFATKSNFSNSNTSGHTFIYMAIRRGPLAEPTAVDDVFDVDTVQASSGNQPAFKFNFVTDFLFSRQVTATQDWLTNARLLGQNQLKLNSNGAQTTNSAYNWDYMDGAWDPFSASPVFSAWGWKRAPGFFDVTTWQGNGVNGRQITHNLGVAPEMIWVKLRNTYSGEWMVFHKDLTTNNNLILESTAGESAYARVTSPTATTFTVSNDTSVNNTVSGGLHYIAFMWASVSGISKVGSYTGNGTSQTIDCGFSNGVRLVLVKQVSSGSWFLFDYGRSIVSGNDSLLQLNASGGEYTGADYIDPHSSGFIAVGDNNNMNTNGQKFIFYAIAA